MTSTDLARRIADALSTPEQVLRRHRPRTWWRQSLAAGALAIALLHVERARAERSPWSRAHDWLRYITTGPIDHGPGSNLHYGAPALAYVLHHAAADRPDRYARALATLDTRIQAATHQRLETAHRRIDTGQLPTLAEFDAIRGLTGLGAYWLSRDPAGQLPPDVLSYLVRLTEPLRRFGGEVPGWWTHLGPTGRSSHDFPDGHANNGVAHGIAGPLALLALAARAGIRVSDHDTALERICSWLDQCRRVDTHRTWWPYWITRADCHRESYPDHDTGRRGPGRPSWCYGTAGLARAQQLAALAQHNSVRVRLAEAALLDVVTAPDLTHRLPDPSLCHGLTGLLHIAHRAATDSDTTGLAQQLPRLRALVETDGRVIQAADDPTTGAFGLLEGAPGIALALSTTLQTSSGWDTCLLIN